MVRIFNTEWREIRNIVTHMESLNNGKINEKNELVGVCSQTNILYKINLNTGERQNLSFIKAHQLKYLEIKSGIYLITAIPADFNNLNKRDCAIYLLDTIDQIKIVKEIKGNNYPMYAMHGEFSSRCLVFIPNKNGCQIFDLERDESDCVKEIPFNEEFIKLISFTPEGKLLISDLKTHYVLLDPDNSFEVIKYEKTDDLLKNKYVPVSKAVDPWHLERPFPLYRKRDSFHYEKIGIQFGDKITFHFVSNTAPNSIIRGKDYICEGQVLENYNPSSLRIIKSLVDSNFIPASHWNESQRERFKRLHAEVLNPIYGELYEILKSGNKLTYEHPQLGEREFWGKYQKDPVYMPLPTQDELLQAVNIVAQRMGINIHEFEKFKGFCS